MAGLVEDEPIGIRFLTAMPPASLYHFKDIARTKEGSGRPSRLEPQPASKIRPWTDTNQVVSVVRSSEQARSLAST
jgi:hypothetical protein